jgi:oxygen-independent coproporphyrinogen-3 oxidase
MKPEVERDFGIVFDEHFASEIERLRELEQDGLVRVFADRIEVAALGRIFIRNVAMVFDEYLNTGEKRRPRLFSKTL